MLFEQIQHRKRPVFEYIFIAVIFVLGMVSAASHFVPAFNGVVASLVLMVAGDDDTQSGKRGGG
jgi:hypothetical protein